MTEGTQPTPPVTGSPEWASLVTASKVAGILGVSPWTSQRATWHLMRGDLTSEEPTDVQRRGQYLEDGVLRWWMDQHPEYAHTVTQPWCTTVPWGGAQPDVRARTEDGRVVLVEAKTAADDSEWGTPGTDEVPTHYLAQCYWQLAMDPGAERVHIPVLTSHLRLVEYVVERDAEVIADLVERCARFHASLTSDTPPPLDDHPATVAVLKALNPDIDRGTSVVLSDAEAVAWVATGAALKDAEAAERQARAVVLDRMGRAQYATDPTGTRVARRQNAARGVSLVRTATLTDLIGDTAA